MALAAADDGRIFVAELGGAIRVVADGVVQPEPFATIEVYTLGECGLLGITLDPDFAENGDVYVFATVSAREQQIIRLTDVDGIGVEPTVIRGNLPTTGSVHNGGGLRAGPDRMLYFSVGDTGDSELSQQLLSLAGKIGRIALDGTTPDDNPFTTPNGAPRAVYARGFRNPFRFCFAPDGRLFVGDVGSDGDERREELNLVRAGENYGWPEVEGFDAAAAFPDGVEPLLAYTEEGSSIAGIVYYAAGQFPAEYAGNLFHLDFVSGGLFRIVLDGDRVVSHTLFYQADSGPVDLIVDTEGSLLYTEMFTGNVQRIRYPAGISAPADEDADSPPASDDLSSNGADVVVDSTASPALCGVGVLQALITSISLFAVSIIRPRCRAG